MDQELWWKFLEAERGNHEKHDGLVSPEQVLSAQTDKKIEDQRRGGGAIEHRIGEECVNDSRTATPLRAVTACAGSFHEVQELEGEGLEQREGREEVRDQHPEDKDTRIFRRRHEP